LLLEWRFHYSQRRGITSWPIVTIILSISFCEAWADKEEARGCNDEKYQQPEHRVAVNSLRQQFCDSLAGDFLQLCNNLLQTHGGSFCLRRFCACITIAGRNTSKSKHFIIVTVCRWTCVR
jgi:hypothetical protein